MCGGGGSQASICSNSINTSGSCDIKILSLMIFDKSSGIELFPQREFESGQIKTNSENSVFFRELSVGSNKAVVIGLFREYQTHLHPSVAARLLIFTATVVLRLFFSGCGRTDERVNGNWVT